VGQPYQLNVPQAVATLLETTKQLQEMLRLWSISRASEQHVSDIYVRLGTEFNSTVAAFQNFGIDMRSALILFCSAFRSRLTHPV
jgi:hypothetical protein